MKSKMKRTLAVFLTMLMLLTSNSSVLSVMADAAGSGTEISASSSAAEDTTDNGAATPTVSPSDGPVTDPVTSPEPTVTQEPAATQEPAVTPAQEAASETQSSRPAAVNSLKSYAAPAAEENKNFEFEASINTSGNRTADVQSGDTFDYILGYTVLPLTGGANYTAVTIQIPLDGTFANRLSVVGDEAGIGGLSVTGEDVQSAYVRRNTLYIGLKTTLTTGTGRRITIKFQTSNFEWEEGSEIQLNPTLTGSVSDGTLVTGSLVSGKEAKVTVRASDGWDITKSVGTVTSDDDYYYVPYTLNLQNTDSSGKVSDTDRMGRLKLASGIVIQDVLPGADSGQMNDDGEHIGYPQGGAAAEITDVSMSSGDGTTVTLQQGTDYTYTPGDTSITLNRTATASEDGAYIGAGTPVNTTYTYTVKYPKMPYLSPSNVPAAEEYWLQNAANLKYTLLGQPEKTDSDTAEIVLGEKSDQAGFQNLTVRKHVQIGSEEYEYSEGRYGTVAFALYTDEECNNIAYNYTGTSLAGAEQKVGSGGSVSFYQLSPGTYYLKETVKGNGLENADDVVKITLAEDGTVTVGADETTAEVHNNQVVVTNTADTYGNVEFYKYGKDSEGATKPLKGTAFVLTDQKDTSKVYEAVSDKNGRVFFEGIPEGTYTLQETKVTDSDYLVNDQKITVTVKGGQINYPVGLPNADGLSNVGGAPVFENISGKGKFRFLKVDSQETDVNLEGAKFELYGPYDSQLTEIPEGSDPVQMNGSDYILVSGSKAVTSRALEAGYYILKEIEAPTNYAIIGDGLTSVLVTANTVNENTYIIKNDEKVKLVINKVGTIQSSSGQTVTTEQLAGAIFEIYDDPDSDTPIATVETYLDGTKNSVSGIRQPDGSFTDLYLAPGAYYYKEITAPDGYEVNDTSKHKVQLSDGNNIFKVTNKAIYGQIILTKTDRVNPDAKLRGARFQVFQDETCQTPLTDSSGAEVFMVTDTEGRATATVPAAETGKTVYYLKEVSAPDGYVLSDEIIKVEVEANHQTEVTAENDQSRSIEVTKKDSVTAGVLGGASFELYGPYDGDTLTAEEKAGLNKSSDTYIGKKTTNTSKGQCTFSGLEPGKWYYLKEVGVPSGYKLSAEVKSIKTTEASSANMRVSVDFRNDRLGKIIVQKTTNMDAGSQGTLPMAGVTFTLYRAKFEDGQWQADGGQIASGITALSGGAASVVFDNLEPGDYLLQETVPEGYEPVADIHVQVTPGYNQTGYNNDHTTVVNNVTTKGKLELDKVSSTNSNTHITATFAIYRNDGSGQPEGEALGTITTTGKSGQYAATGWLEAGDYVLVETEVNGNYTLDAVPVPFSIEAGKTTSLTGDSALTNAPKGQVRFHKYASFGLTGQEGQTVEYDLTGAVIRLYKKTGENPAADITSENYESPADVINLTSSATGVSRLLDAGDYWIVEASFPEDYHAGTDAVSLTIGGETVWVVGPCEITPGQTAGNDNEIPVKNYTDKGKLRINKRDYNNQNRLLDGAQFEVYKTCDEGTVGAVQAPDGAWVVKVQVTASTDDRGYIMESGTHGTGSALSIDIEAGTYYIKEVDLTKVNQQYGGTWYPYGGEWSGPITVTEGKETGTDFLNYQMTGPGTKVSDTGATLKGAVFAAFEDSTSAGSFISYLKSLNLAVNVDNRMQLAKDLKAEAFLQQHGIAEVSSVSGSNGQFEFESLQPGNTYYIVEAVAPEGYALGYTAYTVVVKDDGSGFTSALQVVDYKLGRLTVKKVTELNGETYTVAGMGFKVYQAVEDAGGSYESSDGTKYTKASETPLASGTTGSDGIYTSVLLEAGFYIVEETEADLPADSPVSMPSDVKDTYRVIEVEAGKTASEAVFNNPAVYGKFIFKKVDQNGKLITGTDVKFKLYRQAADGQSWEQAGGEITAPKTGTGIYESGFLPAGNYKLVETAASGYTIQYGEDHPLAFSIEGGKITGSVAGNDVPSTEAGLDQPLVLTNVKQGSLKLLKVGMFDGGVYDSNLQGVEFTLYTDSSCAEESKVSSRTTNGSGICTWTNLDAGTYYLKETGTKSGTEAGDGKYTLSEAVRTVVIGAGESVALDDADGDSRRFENDTAYGKFQVRKTDANDGSGLGGAVFEIYTDEGCMDRAKDIRGANASVTTEAEGTGTSPLLPAGAYYLKEITAPDGYAVDVEHAVTGPYMVTTNAVTAAGSDITNTKLFSIMVNKKVTGTDNVLPGAKIALYDDEDKAKGGAEADAVDVQNTDSSGRVRFTNLRFAQIAQTFYVRELAAPAGYDVNTEIYEITVAYSRDQTEFTFEKDGGVLYDDKLGTVTIHKQGSWQGIDDTAQVSVDLSGVTFSLYKVENCGEVHSADAQAAAEITTDSQGLASSKGLEAGWYELAESKVPEGYAQAPSYWVQITNNTETKTVYAADGSTLEDDIITNHPAKGRFTLYKYDGSETEAAGDLTQLSGAVFKLEKFNGDTWEVYNPDQPTFTMNSHEGDSSYTSGYLEPGQYRITEVTAPVYSYTDSSSTQKVITFSLLEKPMEFSIEAGVTRKLTAYNSPKGTITLTKYGVDGDGTTKAVLSGATYKLYRDENCENEVEGSLGTTDTNGIITWTELDPGDYWIKETADGENAVNSQGYGITDEAKKVTIETGALVTEVKTGVLDKTVSFEDPSNAGKLRILKTNEDGTNKLTGAEFKIYAKDASQADGWNREPLQTLTITNASEGVVSDFLPAEAGGTEYKIVETRAPEDYTLDSDLSVTERVVTVYPFHTPAEAEDDTQNCLVFANKKDDSITGLGGQIHKQIREARADDDETTFTDGPVTAAESLLNSEYHVEFKLDGYADGTNEKPVKDLTVTDNSIGLQYIEKINDGAEAYRDLTAADRDYSINSVTVNASANGDIREKAGAVIYAQYSMDEKTAGIWNEVKTLADISENQTVQFDRPVVGVKVEYTNVLEKFESDGILLNVTFANRGEWSTENDPEVRRVNNTASITWKDTYLDAAGQEQTREYSLNSNQVIADIPSFVNKIPEIQVKTEITDNKQTFYSGDEINFRVTAENMSDDDPEKVLRQAVLSFKLPAQTTLDETQWEKGFLVKKISADGASVVIPSRMYNLTATETTAAERYYGGDSYEESGQYPTTQYAFEFADSDLTRLAPGERIEIGFTGYITYEQKPGFNLVIPAYLSSTAKIPKSAENPKGLSFTPYSQVLYENDVTDGMISNDLSYVNDTDTAFVTNTTAVQLLKEIGVKNSDGTITWLPRGEVAKVHPSEEIYYRLTLYNYSDTFIEKAKLVDIFPCADDTYVLSSGEIRGTDIPFGEGYEDMKLLEASGEEDKGAVTWYSTDYDWSTRSDDERSGILQPMYYKASDWSQGWTAGVSTDASALGMEIDFTNGGVSEGLASAGTYQIVLTMKTPGYTADKISEYYGKYMDNSAAVSVVKQGSSALVTEIPLEDQAEPNKVRATMDLPTGAIGDYVWFDRNLDGIQDPEEAAVEGMTVELWQTRYYEFNGSVRRDIQKVGSTQTDQDGRYLFTGLACQYLANGAEEGSTDPSDYVGSEYYTYQVKFVRGDRYAGYTFTQQYAGDNLEADSDASASGESGDVTLSISSNPDGTLSGETNLTIDAGIVQAYAIGDYVWLDTNCNGVQDDGEAGVPDVPVFLYKVGGADGEVQTDQDYVARTVTDSEGRYWFEGLMEGYYVVEFDISNLKKQNGGGYTYRYDFTSCGDVAAGESGTDSDARINVDEDGRIRRTNVISLTEEDLNSQGIYNRTDPRWDAGLVVYSAIGGFVFDDQDYDDLQSIYIPLEGTLVELYEVVADGSLSEQPMASQTVGADGTYYFDHLAFGTEYKDYSVKFTYPAGYYGVEANADGDNGTSDPAQDSDKDSDVNRFDLKEDGSGADRTYGYINRIRLGQDIVTTTWDAGARMYSTIGDYVWIDENKDGIQDPEETPVPGVIVVLQSRKDSESEWEYAAYTVTDENGRYEFTELESSSRITKEYRVVFNLSENTHITALNSGNNSAADSDAIGTYMKDITPLVTPEQTHAGGYVTTYIKPGYGETDLTWDAGIIKVYGAIGDYVWYDDDHDGIQDEDEKGVAGVPVVLEMNTSGNSRDESAWVAVGKTTTDADGKYLFEGLEAGYYRVKFQIPEDYVNTRYNRGTGDNGDEIDSDASRRAGDRWYYTSAFYLNEGAVDLTWDAGIYKPTTRTERTTTRTPVNRVTRVRTTRSGGTRTGDNTQTIPYVVLAFAGLGGCIAIVVVRKKKKGNKSA